MEIENDRIILTKEGFECFKPGNYSLLDKNGIRIFNDSIALPISDDKNFDIKITEEGVVFTRKGELI